MIAEIRKSPRHFAVLALTLILGLTMLFVFRYSPFIQQIVVWSLSAAYLAWGIAHHLLKRDLTGLIVLEYLLVSGLAGLILSSVLAAR